MRTQILYEASRIVDALLANDPRLAKPVVRDKDMNWLCSSCPYRQKCYKMLSENST